MNDQLKEMGLEIEGGPWEIKEKNFNAVALGSIRTEKKAQTSRENGKRGGRPKKVGKTNTI